MKRILLTLICLALLFAGTEAQVQSKIFKSGTKSVVSAHTTFLPTVVNGSRNLKSAPVAKSSYSQASLAGLNLTKTSDTKTIITGDDNNTPIFIQQKASKLKSASVQDKCFTFLRSIGKEMHIDNPESCFVITSENNDNLGQQHIRLAQKYHGITVNDADFYVHFSSQNETMNGRYFVIPENIKTIPEITAENALNTVVSDLKKHTVIHTLTSAQQNLLDYTAPVIDTVIYNNKSGLEKFCLAYKVIFRPNYIDEWIYFIDANNGAIIHKYNNTKFDGPATANATDLNGVSRSIKTYLESGKYYMIDIAEPMYNSSKGEGYIMTIDAQNTTTANLSYVDITSSNNSWNNPKAVSAQFNAMQTYSYFKNTFNRNSINGQGGNIISLINVADEDGSSMANAFWNGAAIFYGNGGTLFKPLAGGLDVAAHEIGHGVTQNTAGLEYQGESGAMNEAFSDIFGSMVDRSNWYIGETVTNTSFISTGRLRDMSDPHNGNGNGWQPKHTSEMYSGTEDNGGVHTNSGIINYAYYLYATAITKDKAEQVFYRALTTYLTKSSQFLDLRLAVIQSAKDLYGDNANEVDQAKTAFDAVGIYEDQPVVVSDNYPENPGQDYLLMDNTDAGDANTLYRSSVTATNFTPLSATKMKRRVSVIDDGSVAAFVSDDSKLRAITLNPPNQSETILSNDAFWDNVAVSKDGNRLAAVSNVLDTSIYVYDFITQKWAKFVLYNPTTQEGVKSGGVQFADAIEFDHTGEYLIYDSYNTIKSTTGDDINYWDIGIINVWNNQTNTFGDGTIAKLFGSLPDSVSIGNPTFSKNSPNIIAFDYLNESTNEYAILGLNLETSDLGVIAVNNTIGFPSYSKSDDKVAFSALDANQPAIDVATLNSDKISSSVSPAEIIIQAQWPVYYATGTRVLGLAPVASFAASYINGNAPLAVKFTDNSKNSPTAWQWTFTGGNPASSNEQNPTVTYSSAGTFSVTLKVTNSFGNNSMVKTGYITVSQPNDVPEIKSSVMVYPNPVRDVLFISGYGIPASATIKIYSVEGRLVSSMAYTDKIDVSKLKEGVYILVIDTGLDIIKVKVVKTE